MTENSLDKIIVENKTKYGKVFSVPLNKSTEFFFRPLTIGEYEKIEGNELLTSAEVEDAIVSTCVFWPIDFNTDSFQAGIITSLSEEILDNSNLSDIEKAESILINARQKANTITNVMKSTVLALYDVLGIGLADLNAMTFEQLCQIVTLAEQIVKIKKTIYDPTVELEISFEGGEDQAQENASDIDPTALKLQQALYGG